MWFYIILAIPAILLILRAHSLGKLVNKIKSEGGMAIKYKTIIEHINKTTPGSYIAHELGRILFINSDEVNCTYKIKETWENVNIEQSMYSPLTGPKKLSWTFNKHMSHDSMTSKMQLDFLDYIINNFDNN